MFGSDVRLVERAQAPQRHPCLPPHAMGGAQEPCRPGAVVGGRDRPGQRLQTPDRPPAVPDTPLNQHRVRARLTAISTTTVKTKERTPGYRLVDQPPLLRHFRCKLEPVPP